MGRALYVISQQRAKMKSFPSKRLQNGHISLAVLSPRGMKGLALLIHAISSLIFQCRVFALKNGHIRLMTADSISPKPVRITEFAMF